MYKKHSKFFNRASNTSIEVENFSKALAGAARSGSIKNKGPKAKDELGSPKICSECGKVFFGSEVTEHLYVVHRISTCKFCRRHIHRSKLVAHIKEVHGEAFYERWLELKKNK